MGGRTDKLIDEFLTKLGQAFKIEKVILFGSRAKGDALKKSDYDLIIVSSDFQGIPFIKRMTLVYKFWTLDIALEALCYTPEEFKKKSRQITIVSQAVKEGIEISAA